MVVLSYNAKICNDSHLELDSEVVLPLSHRFLTG